MLVVLIKLLFQLLKQLGLLLLSSFTGTFLTVIVVFSCGDHIRLPHDLNLLFMTTLIGHFFAAPSLLLVYFPWAMVSRRRGHVSLRRFIGIGAACAGINGLVVIWLMRGVLSVREEVLLNLLEAIALVVCSGAAAFACFKLKKELRLLISMGVVFAATTTVAYELWARLYSFGNIEGLPEVYAYIMLFIGSGAATAFIHWHMLFSRVADVSAKLRRSMGF